MFYMHKSYIFSSHYHDVIDRLHQKQSSCARDVLHFASSPSRSGKARVRARSSESFAASSGGDGARGGGPRTTWQVDPEWEVWQAMFEGVDEQLGRLRAQSSSGQIVTPRAASAFSTFTYLRPSPDA